jgi:uncharacterized membrane protein
LRKISRTRRDGDVIPEVVFVSGVALLGISYYFAMYGRGKKRLKDWETDRGMLLSILAQNIVLLVGVFLRALHRSVLFPGWEIGDVFIAGWWIDTILLAAQLILFLITMVKAFGGGRGWAIPVATLIAALHAVAYF